jgi:hypothetical protein
MLQNRVFSQHDVPQFSINMLQPMPSGEMYPFQLQSHLSMWCLTNPCAVYLIYLSSLSFPLSLPQFYYTLLYPLFINYLFYSVIFAVICCWLQSMVYGLLCGFARYSLSSLCAYIHTCFPTYLHKFATSYVLYLAGCSLLTSLIP